MILTKSDIGAMRVATEEQWKLMEGEFLNGSTFKAISGRYGIRVCTLQYQATRRKWRERLAASKLGVDYNPQPKVDIVGPDIEIDEARTLRGRHGKAYYKELDQVREQIDQLSERLAIAKDMDVLGITKAIDLLRERYRIIQGIPLPGKEIARKTKTAPVLPLD